MSSLTKRFFCPAKILAGQHALAQSSGEDHGQEQVTYFSSKRYHSSFSPLINYEYIISILICEELAV